MPTMLSRQSVSWPWPLNPWPRTNMGSPSHHKNSNNLACSHGCYIVNNFSMIFQIWAQIVLCSISRRFKRFMRQNRPWSLTLWPKIHKVPPLIINNICVKNKTYLPISINKHPSVTVYKAIHLSGFGLQNQREHHII